MKYKDKLIKTKMEKKSGMAIRIRRFFTNYQEFGIRNFSFSIFSQHKYLHFKIFISYKKFV